ncbi:hypothetical protein LWI29_002275 [Acer saccharum]|uniref:Uncharacterized protein n=1 Tax=Acer saccharum TaxID=4024 RepID=A0AA39VHX1_ACESA|nr:hypothetical protein LWI29_002275 [Acer saccharum]
MEAAAIMAIAVAHGGLLLLWLVWPRKPRSYVMADGARKMLQGSTCKQGEIEAIVIATGVHTFFGKAAHLVYNTTYVLHFQKVLTAIGNFCSCSIALGMVIEIIVIYGIQHGISYWYR